MTPDTADPSHRPLLPPEPDAEYGHLRWVLIAAALLLLVVGGYQAYQWLNRDVAQRSAVAEGAAPASAPAAAGEPPTLAAPAAPARSGPLRPGAAAQEPAAPAVSGEAIHKCVSGGHVTYTNQPCPEGASADAAPATGLDPNGVSGSAGDGVPALVARPAPFSATTDPSQQAAACRYLAAEIERLDFEFRQPLPPPVLDHISTLLGTLRAQSGAARCVPPQADAAAPPARGRAAPKVVEEKRGG
ncbi:hypothetical protein [Ottowia sp.]|jgi:hypothetical protein|uniref:hypothetical protein n=1 Tax=Ottowia sp. TaxID=1898956 RepID=UPI0025F86ACB|nr:hypothetical protein [Ottowia sp.]MBK6614924.1 hypothetical protein [Ottowia sp.]